jgi:hypothetical protein
MTSSADSRRIAARADGDPRRTRRSEGAKKQIDTQEIIFFVS